MSEEIIRPWVGTKRAALLAETEFGIHPTEIKELISYDDRNFYIKTEDTNRNKEATWPHGYILKVTNWKDSLETEVFEAVNDLLLHLSNSGISCSRPIPTLSGSLKTSAIFPIGSESAKENKRCLIRLFTFLPGKTLHEKEVTKEICLQWGALLGKLHTAFRTFSSRVIENRFTMWSLYNAPKIRKVLYVITDDSKKSLVQEVLREFETILPTLRKMPQGIVHGDLNEQNVLVKGDGADSEVYAVLDWGDVHGGPEFLDVAVMLAYVLMAPAPMHQHESVGVALAGYLKAHTTQDLKLDHLKILIAGRLCQSLVYGMHTYTLCPYNDYTLVTQTRGWAVLEELWKTPSEELLQLWSSILKQYNVKGFDDEN